MLPAVISSLHKFLSQHPENVAVLHCKAGKGRSGTIFCAYLIAQHRWTAQKALAHFTARRMRSGFGEGVSILSQRRWISYVETWSRDPNREYREIPAVVTEVRILNPVKGVEVQIRGFKEHGRKVVTLFQFGKNDYVEYKDLSEVNQNQSGRLWFGANDDQSSSSGDDGNNETEESEVVSIIRRTDSLGSLHQRSHRDRNASLHRSGNFKSVQYNRVRDPEMGYHKPSSGFEVVLRPRADIHVTADINISAEKKIYGPAGLSFLSSTAYAWFNVFFEGDHDTGGTFSIKWEDMDGFKGTKKRGGKIFDRIEVDWVVCHPMEFPVGTQNKSEIDLQNGRHELNVAHQDSGNPDRDFFESPGEADLDHDSISE